VQAASSDGIGRGKAPVWKDRLHDLEPVRHPVDARKKLSLVHSGLGCTPEAKRDLGLDARLLKPVETEAVSRCDIADCRVVHVSPDRRMHPVLGPDRPVGEADLPPDRSFAARYPAMPDRGGDPVGGIEVEAWIGAGQGRDLARLCRRREHLRGYKLDVQQRFCLSGLTDHPVLVLLDVSPDLHSAAVRTLI
jgi:hypothetical protein